MNATELQALIVLRNHAQAILNGARADLKLSKEDKSSLMNGLKKVDELFIKQFENSVDTLTVVTKSRTWTSTENEEEAFVKALVKEVNTKGQALSTSEEVSVGTLPKAAVEVQKNSSEVKTVPVVTLDSKKAKRGFKRA